ncbi:unnamed protein product, partial [Vitis vinifera]
MHGHGLKHGLELVVVVLDNNYSMVKAPNYYPSPTRIWVLAPPSFSP